MANIKSAKKRIGVIAKKTEVNKSRKTAMKTAEKKFLAAVEAGDVEGAKALFGATEAIIMKTGVKGTIHKKKASRKVSRLAKRMNAIGQ